MVRIAVAALTCAQFAPLRHAAERRRKLVTRYADPLGDLRCGQSLIAECFEDALAELLVSFRAD